MNRHGVVLFAHGARDPRWAEPFERLRTLVAGLVAARSFDTPVELAYLELMVPDLAVAIERLAGQGCTSVVVVPIFLGQGGHIRRDLPAQIERVRASHPELSITCATAAGEDDAVLKALAQYCVDVALPDRNI